MLFVLQIKGRVFESWLDHFVVTLSKSLLVFPPRVITQGYPPVSVFWEEWGGHTGLLTLTLLKGSDQIFKQLKENIVCCTDFSQKAYLFLGLARQDQCNSPLRMAHTRMANYEKPSPPPIVQGPRSYFERGRRGRGTDKWLKVGVCG